MEAPEKIYIPIDNTIEPKFLEDYWFEFPVSGQEVEYTCTDVFIEKAKKWLYLQLNEINMKGEDMENFLKDFKKYMES